MEPFSSDVWKKDLLSLALRCLEEGGHEVRRPQAAKTSRHWDEKDTEFHFFCSDLIPQGRFEGWKLRHPRHSSRNQIPSRESRISTSQLYPTFVDEFVSGKLSPSIKSEPIPKDQDGPVHVLVADEFDKVVFDESKDLLVEFYAPWCGHCKKLAPTYDSLGEKYKEHKDKITIAKMDGATTNDVPPSAGFSVQSFPTIKFRKAGSKEFMDFNGDRTLEGFVDFIGLNAVNKVPVNLEAVNETVEEVKEAPKKAAHEEVSVTRC
ncbi:hypothetical protein L7F22_025481 [Adiantum nelumboides]|nr:hypothetical protein [Adiantum nelumboides]